MKFASYKDGSRDGQLVVVSRDLTTAHYASGIASKLQQALDDWNFMSPQLQELYETLNSGKARYAFPFDPERCMAPLPRAFQWVSSSAFSPQGALAHKSGKAEKAEKAEKPEKTRNGQSKPSDTRTQSAELPEAVDSDPLLHQGASDNFTGPCDAVVVTSEDLGVDFAAEIAVITGDLPLGATPEQALDGVRLLMLANGVSLRHLMAGALAPGVGMVKTVQSQPTTAFSPVAITPDEVGAAWDQGRLHLTVQSTWNGRKLGMCEAGPEMRFDFGQLLAHLCRTRRVRAGSIVGSGPVRNQDRSHGYSCIADKRATEILENGQAQTEFMRYDDTLRIEVKGKDGQSVFGAIQQTIAAPGVLSNK